MQQGGQLVDVTSDVRQTDPLKISWGGSVVTDNPKPGTVDLRLADPLGKYRIHDPRSPLYGIASRNTPLYVVDSTGSVYEDFEDTTFNVSIGDGGSGNVWSRNATSPHTGSWCFKSATVSASTNSYCSITYPTGTNMCVLWYRVDCDPADTVQILSGNVVQATPVSATGGVWTQIVLPAGLSNGVAQAQINYSRGATGSGGSVYIDDVTFYNSRAAAEITQWTPDREVGFNGVTGSAATRGDQWCDIHAEGILGRIGGWTELLDSAMTRSISKVSGLVGHWPGEDGSDSTQMANRLSNGAPALLGGSYSFNEDGPSGSASALGVNADTTARGSFASTSATGWTFGYTHYVTAAPGSATNQPTMTFTASNGYTYYIYMNNTQWNVQVWDKNGTNLLNSSHTYDPANPETKQVMHFFKATLSGTTVTLSHTFVTEFAPSFTNYTDTFTGTVGRLTGWVFTGGSYTTGGTLCQIFGTTLASFDPVTLMPSLSGYAGESAVNRIKRLCAEQGVMYSKYIPSVGTAEAMGPQRPDTFLNLVQQAAETDGGLLNSSAAGIAIEYRSRDYLYRQTAALSLTYGTNVAPPMIPAIDNQSSWNQVTASQENGGSYTAEDSTSSMGSAPPPVGIGLVKKSVDVSVQYESRLSDIAGWWLGSGTVPDARYPSVTIDLDANQSLESTVAQLRPGHRIQVSGLDPNVIDLMIIGIVDTQDSQKRRLVTFNCLPYGVWQVGQWDATDNLYDSGSTTLSSDVTSSATALTLTTSNAQDVWASTGNGTPYDITVAGERMTVSAMRAANSVAVTDASFEVSGAISVWTGAGGTLSLSTAQAHSGVNSALITVSGSPTQATMRQTSAANFAPIVAGDSYQFSYWIYSSVALTTVGGIINWYSNSSTYVSSSNITTQAVPANTWTKLSTAVVAAPAGITLAQFGPTVAGSPANGTLLYFDDIDMIHTSGSGNLQVATVTRGVNGFSKAQLAGAPVHVFNKAYWGL